MITQEYLTPLFNLFVVPPEFKPGIDLFHRYAFPHYNAGTDQAVTDPLAVPRAQGHLGVFRWVRNALLWGLTRALQGKDSGDAGQHRSSMRAPSRGEGRRASGL